MYLKGIFRDYQHEKLLWKFERKGFKLIQIFIFITYILPS